MPQTNTRKRIPKNKYPKANIPKKKTQNQISQKTNPPITRRHKVIHTAGRSSVGSEDCDQNGHEEVVGMSLQTNHPVADDAEHDRVYNKARDLWRGKSRKTI